MPYKVPRIGVCAAPNCKEQILVARNLCKRHYQRFRRNGTIDDVDHRLGRPVADGNKYCTHCNLELLLTDFRCSSRGRPADYCKTCEAIYYKKRKMEKIAKSECIACGRPAIAGLTYCDYCRRRGAQYRATFSGRARHMLVSVRSRSAKQKVPCTIDIDWIMGKLIGRCELTGIPFDLEGKRNYVKQRFNPYAPSIDRRIAAGEYSPENCRMVLIALNVGINHWGEEVYRLIAKSYLRQRREKKRQRVTSLTSNYDLPLEGQHAGSVRIRKH